MISQRVRSLSATPAYWDKRDWRTATWGFLVFPMSYQLASISKPFIPGRFYWMRGGLRRDYCTVKSCNRIPINSTSIFSQTDFDLPRSWRDPAPSIDTVLSFIMIMLGPMLLWSLVKNNMVSLWDFIPQNLYSGLGTYSLSTVVCFEQIFHRKNLWWYSWCENSHPRLLIPVLRAFTDVRFLSSQEKWLEFIDSNGEYPLS